LKSEYDRRREELEKKFPFWERLTIADRFDKLADEYAEREYIYTPQKSYTYREIREMSDKLAKGLIKLGIKNREHVAVVMANYPEFVIITLALSKIGAVKVPLNYRLRQDELEYVINQSDSICLITMDKYPEFDYISTLKCLCPEVFRGETSPKFPMLRKIVIFSESGTASVEGAEDYHKVMAAGSGVTAEEYNKVRLRSRYPDEVSDIMYTSGTTSKPKGVLQTHDMLLRSAYGSCLNRAFEDGRRIFVPIPFYHVFAYVEGILAASLVGGCIVPQVKFDVAEALKLIQDGKVNDVLCVPAVAINLINQPDLNSYDLSPLRAIYCAGTPTPLWTWREIQEKLHLTELNTGYGMTELMAGVLQTAPGDPVEVIASRVGRQMPGGCSGLPEFGFRHIEFKVVDPVTGVDLPPGSEGEWAARGNIVTRGYYKKPLETAEVIDKDGFLRTGDVGIIHDNGYFELTGRSKEIYRIAGENVAPKEIEEALEQNPKVYRACVVGVPYKKIGEVGMAFITLREGETCTEDEIIGYCCEKLAHFKVPKFVKLVKESEWPMTSSFKIQKFKLREMAIKELSLEEN